MTLSDTRASKLAKVENLHYILRNHAIRKSRFTLVIFTAAVDEDNAPLTYLKDHITPESNATLVRTNVIKLLNSLFEKTNYSQLLHF